MDDFEEGGQLHHLIHSINTVSNRQQQAEQPSTKKQSQIVRPPKPPSHFTKCTTATFLKSGICHMCRGRTKLVYQCYRNYLATSCDKKFCLDCLVLVYKENIIDIIQRCDSWKCPYIKKICRCKTCCLTRRQTESILEIDPSQPIINYVKSKKPQQPNSMEEEEIEEELDENMRCMLKQKFRKLIDFNGQLLSKYNSNLHKLNEEEAHFYNKIIHSNLKVLDRLSRSMIQNGAIAD